MGFFKQSSGEIEIGVAKGMMPGHLGVWATWNAEKTPNEVYRVVVKPESPERRVQVDNFSYTFGPAHEKSFAHSLETPWEFKQFLVGWDRAKEGTVTFEFWLANGVVLSKTYPVAKMVEALRGKGCDVPSAATWAQGFLEKDKPEISAIKHTELKTHSEKIKQQLEEKRRLEEEARKKKEAEAAAALAKAAEAAKAAAAKAAGGSAPASNADRTKPTISACKAAIFYGSSTGNTKNVADMIKAELGESVAHVLNVTDIHPVDLTVPEVIILGIPTWHIGELQDDWAAMINDVAAQNYTGKKVAIFGLGDGKGYAETYVDAMDELLQKFEKTGAKLHGLWPTDGYEFKKSKAIRNGKFVGLVIDIENQDQLSDKRVKGWTAQLRTELGL